MPITVRSSTEVEMQLNILCRITSFPLQLQDLNWVFVSGVLVLLVFVLGCVLHTIILMVWMWAHGVHFFIETKF